LSQLVICRQLSTTGRVLLGANPKDLPLEEVAIEEMGISRGYAAQLGVTIPPEFSQYLRP
jgi:ABC-type uncharacterized transport system substrate-binding protein